MSIIRVIHNQENPFVQLNKKALWDKNLSLKAVGLWARCMSRPDNWEFSVKELVSKSKEGRRAIDGAIKELIEAGYALRLEYYEKSEDGRFNDGGFEYVFFEFPATEEDKEKALDEFKKSFRNCGFSNLRNRNRQNSNLLIKNSSNLPLEGTKKEANQNRVAKATPTPVDSFYKEKFENKILITPEQRQKLVDKFGLESTVDHYAEKLYRYSLNRPAQFKKYKRHDLTIEDWIEKDLAKEDVKATKKQPTASKWYLKNLSDQNRENFMLNEELVDELKADYPNECGGLWFYYNSHILKDKNNTDFDISGLVDHGTFCRAIDKKYGLKTFEVRKNDGKIR